MVNQIFNLSLQMKIVTLFDDAEVGTESFEKISDIKDFEIMAYAITAFKCY